MSKSIEESKAFKRLIALQTVASSIAASNNEDFIELYNAILNDLKIGLMKFSNKISKEQKDFIKDYMNKNNDSVMKQYKQLNKNRK